MGHGAGAHQPVYSLAQVVLGLGRGMSESGLVTARSAGEASGQPPFLSAPSTDHGDCFT